MKRIIFLLILFPFLTLKSEEIIIAFDRNYPPYMFKEGEGKPGIYPKLVKEIFKRMKVPLRIKLWSWGRVIKKGREGKSGVGGLYWNKKREKFYDYSHPIFVEKLKVFVEKDKSFTFNKIEDLKGKKIGLNKNWSYGDEIDKAIKSKLFRADVAPNSINNFKKLGRGRIDALFADSYVAKAYLNLPEYKKIIALEVPIAKNNSYVAFAKKMGKKDILDKFNKMLKKMKDDGSYDKILKQSFK